MSESNHQLSFKVHEKSVRKVKRLLKRAYSGSEVEIITVKPVPDIFVVDFENKEVIAIEVSNHAQVKEKKRLYGASDYKKILCFRVFKHGFKPRVYEIIVKNNGHTSVSPVNSYGKRP